MSFSIQEVRLDLRNVDTIEEFHNASKSAFGFPSFYGANMNAWKECLRSIRFPEDGMTRFHLQEDEILVIEILGIEEIEKTLPGLMMDIIVAIGQINDLYVSRFGTIAITYRIS